MGPEDLKAVARAEEIRRRHLAGKYFSADVLAEAGKITLPGDRDTQQLAFSAIYAIVYDAAGSLTKHSRYTESDTTFDMSPEGLGRIVIQAERVRYLDTMVRSLAIYSKDFKPMIGYIPTPDESVGITDADLYSYPGLRAPIYLDDQTLDFVDQEGRTPGGELLRLLDAKETLNAVRRALNDPSFPQVLPYREP